MLIFVAANDLLTMFIALEVFSLPLYLLCALARRRRLLSQEAALKYFLLGAYASAFFLFGVALIYGFTSGIPGRAAGVDFATVHAAVTESPSSPVLLFAGMALLAIGLLFKAAAAPFHVWTPDVYQGAPTPVTGFMAACTKVAAFGALLRVFHVAFAGRLLGLHPGARRGGGADHAGRRGARGHPDRHQAAAGVLVDRERRLPAGRCAGAEPRRALRHDVLPGRVRLLGARRVRRGDAGARRRRGGHPPVPLGRAGPPLAVLRGDLHVHPAGLRRHPADQRLHQQVRGLRPGPGGRPGRGW